MNLPPDYRGRVPADQLRRAREPRLAGRVRAGWLYVGWWWADVIDDLGILRRQMAAQHLPAEDLGCLLILVASGLGGCAVLVWWLVQGG